MAWPINLSKFMASKPRVRTAVEAERRAAIRAFPITRLGCLDKRGDVVISRRPRLLQVIEIEEQSNVTCWFQPSLALHCCK
jgi:hypothetical protein